MIAKFLDTIMTDRLRKREEEQRIERGRHRPEEKVKAGEKTDRETRIDRDRERKLDIKIGRERD